MDARHAEEDLPYDPLRFRAMIGRNIRRLREARGEKQDTVGRGTGMSQSMIARIEAGARMPSAWHLQRLARYFGTTMDALGQEPPRR